MKEVFFDESALGSWLYNNPITSRNDTYLIDPLLCFGLIKNGIVSEKRESFFCKNFWETKEVRKKSDKQFRAFWHFIKKIYEKSLCLSSEKEIRVWYSDIPGELAGLCFICALLTGKETKINVVYQGDFDKEINGWGGYLGSQLKEAAVRLTKTLHNDEIHKYAEMWHKLTEENQNFRTIKNGELVSDFVDFRDGLTSLQRSILYAMNERGYANKDSYKKAVGIVVDVLWHYELYGDYFVYGQIARMTQKFATPYPLISGQGDFGTRRKPHADSYSNTKIKLSKNGENLLENVHSAKVPFVPPFARDRGLAKPEFLPGDFPNVFCNGNYNLIPHKLENVTKMLGAYTKNPDISIEELTSLIGEPNYTDGRIILNPETLPEIYRTGKGFLRYKYTDSEQKFEDEINYTLLKDGEGVLMNLKELVKNYADYRGRLER